MDSDTDPLGWVGKTIDERFAVEQLIGEGGFGYVYRGRHLGFDEPIAIKCLKLPEEFEAGERERFLADFREEARLLHRLSRKTAGIVQALDVGAATSPIGTWTPYIVMEWLQGETLAEQIERCIAKGQAHLSLAAAVELLTPAIEALGVAHATGIAHLDIKPANLFVVEDEDGTTVKVVDFGIAKVLSDNKTLTRALTRGGVAPPFTPSYGAPEQFNPVHGRRGPWTDVFALALVLLEICTGEAALAGDNVLQLYVASATEHLRPTFAAHGIAVPSSVEEVLARAVAVEPENRFPDAPEMWRALREAIAEAESTEGLELGEAPTSPPPPRVDAAIAPTAPSLPVMSPLSTGQTRVCTVLFAELAGTAALAEQLDPERHREIVDHCISELAGCVKTMRGEVYQLVDEGVMAVFGLQGGATNDAERAVHAALRMRRALEERALPQRARQQLRVGLRVGIDTGRVFASHEPAPSGLTTRVTGGPIRPASRLQQAAPPNGILVGRDTYRQVAGLFEIASSDPVKEEGRGPGIKAFRVLGLARDRYALGSMAARDFHGFDTRFVGRAAETEELANFADACEGESQPQLVTVVAPPGLGRSRLLVEFARGVEEQGWSVLAAQCSALQTNSGYALWASLLRGRFHLHEDDPEDVVESKIRRGIQDLRRQGERPTLGPPSMTGSQFIDPIDLEEVTEQLKRVLGSGPAQGGTHTAALSAAEQGAAARNRIAGAIADLLSAASTPVAIVCDDVHWADEASLALLEELLVRLADTPLLVLCSAQPTLFERIPHWGHDEQTCGRVDLRPLARRHLEDMARDRLQKVAGLPATVVRDLAKRADGNPLTLVETLHLLIDAGAVDTEGADGWTLHTKQLDELALPTTVQGVVQARLDRLDEASRDLVLRAAVVGRVFWNGVLAELDPSYRAAGPQNLGLLLQALCDRGLLVARAKSAFPDENELAFAEAATQQVAYEMLGRKARRELHRVVAGWLEARAATDATASLIARHFERAAALDLALKAYVRAAGHAASLGQNAEAVHNYERACRLDDWISGEGVGSEQTAELFLGWEEPDGPRALSWPERVRLRMELGDVLRRMGRLDEAESRYQQARARIVPPGPTDTDDDRWTRQRWAARLDYRMALTVKLRGSMDEALRLAQRAVDLATPAGLVEETAEMLALVAGEHRRRKQFEQARAACLQGIRACRAAPHRTDRWRQAVSKLLNALGGVFYGQGSMVRAERCYLQASRIINDRRNPDQVSQALNNVAAVRFVRGDLAGARESFQRVLRLTERSGDLWMTMAALGNLGEVEHRLARHELARDYLREAVRLGEQSGTTADLTDCYRNLASVEHALDAYDGALAAGRRALDLAQVGGGKVYLAAVVSTLADICHGLHGSADVPATVHQGAKDLAGAVRAVLEDATESALSAEQAAAVRQQLDATLASS